MTQLDVRQLPSAGPFPEENFPASRRADFRVYIAPNVHEGVWRHAGADTSVEICGVLVGLWKRDADGPYAAVTEYIRCEQATSKFAEVTFTHESWSQINREMDSKYADLRIIGWYHSHPDFGIFLSDRDCFIQEHFFSGPGQVAYVVDPVRKLEGLFEWRDGKPVPVSHYWVGDRIMSVQASRSPASGASHGNAARMAAAASAAGPPQSEGWSLTILSALAWLCLFLLGYLVADMQTRWEQRRLAQGAVAHYGIDKLMRLGFEPDLREARARIAAVQKEVEPLLNAPTTHLKEEQREEIAERRKRINDGLNLSMSILQDVEARYGLTDDERRVLALLVVQKTAELSQEQARPAAPAASQPKQAPTKPAESKPKTNAAAIAP